MYNFIFPSYRYVTDRRSQRIWAICWSLRQLCVSARPPPSFQLALPWSWWVLMPRTLPELLLYCCHLPPVGWECLANSTLKSSVTFIPQKDFMNQISLHCGVLVCWLASFVRSTSQRSICLFVRSSGMCFFCFLFFNILLLLLFCYPC